ncbi:MAG: hypothetical protein HDR80_09625 [Bacteroides sp.]|nr:hypothetical protein [Bacteroides sp.]
MEQVCMAYPHGIIPKILWKPEFPASAVLMYVPDAVIARRIEGDVSGCMTAFPGGVYHLRRTALPSDEMEDLSTNLMGASFTLSCMPFRQINKGKLDWKPLKEKVMPVRNVTYRALPGPHTAAGWSISGIHNREIPYPRTFQTEKEYKEWVKKCKATFPLRSAPEFPDYIMLEDDVDDGKPVKKTKAKAFCKVNHKPNNLNYWHYTCNFSSQENPGKDVKGTKGWRESMYALISQIFRQDVMLLESDMDYPCWPTWQTDIAENAGILELWRRGCGSRIGSGRMKRTVFRHGRKVRHRGRLL